MAQFELARDDLEIAPRTIDGETVYFVGDPIKLEFHRLDTLQYEVFKKLDGKTSLQDLSSWLLATHEVEAPPEALAEFVETLRGLNLLDLSTDARIDAARGREIAHKVKQVLAQDGVVFARRTGAPSSTESSSRRRGSERRTRHDEASLFDRALVHLDRGEIQACGRCLREVLRLQPKNARARYLLRALFSETLGKPRDVDSLLWWRIPIGNPDRFLSRLSSSIGRFVYRPATLYAIAALFLFACGLLLADIDRFVVDLKRFFEFRWLFDDPLILVLIWTTGPLQLFLHETAHGLTCRYFGGRVREMGILVAYLSITAYCDISSTYLLDNKAQRALTCLAGILVDIVVWSLFVCVYHVTDSSSLIGLLALISIPIKAESVFMGCNPLIRGDGYFALTEIVNYPNLNDDARAFVKAHALTLVTGERHELPDGAAAHARLFWAYTVGTSVAVSIVLLPIMTGVIGYVVARLQTVGVLLAALMIYGVIGRHAITLLRAMWSGRDVLRRSARARRVAAAAVVFVVVVLLFPLRVTIDAPCRVRPDVDWARAPFPAVVGNVSVVADQPVVPGAPLARLDDAQLAVDVTRARAALLQAEIDLDQLLLGARDEERGIAGAALAAAGGDLAAADAAVARARVRADAGGGREELEAALSAQAAAQTRYATAAKAVAVSASGPQDEAVAAARARVQGLRAQADDAQQKLDRTAIVARARGTVVDGDVPLRELVGQRVATGASIVGVRRQGGDVLEIRVPAVQPISAITRDAVVTARLYGLPHEPITTTVRTVATTVEQATGDDLLYGQSFLRVDAALPQTLQDRGVPAELSGTARIEGRRLPLIAHLWLRAVRLYDLDIRPLL